LVVEPPPLKNMLVKMGEHLPQIFGVKINKKSLSCHHLVLKDLTTQNGTGQPQPPKTPQIGNTKSLKPPTSSTN